VVHERSEEGEKDGKCLEKEGCFYTNPRPLEQKANSIRILLKKVLDKYKSTTFVQTCFGGLAAEKVSGMTGTCFASLRSRRT
jgi:hypothetical protein